MSFCKWTPYNSIADIFAGEIFSGCCRHRIYMLTAFISLNKVAPTAGVNKRSRRSSSR